LTEVIGIPCRAAAISFGRVGGDVVQLILLSGVRGLHHAVMAGRQPKQRKDGRCVPMRLDHDRGPPDFASVSA
jgi:hypothetical protein